MTRINSNLNPRLLTDEHLLAEHREIKRLPVMFKKHYDPSKTPNKFTLGKGHVLFFMNKPRFTFNRYLSIKNECIARGFDITDFSENWDLYGEFKEKDNYLPSADDNKVIIDRITERIQTSNKKTWHYYSKSISPEDAIKLMNNNI